MAHVEDHDVAADEQTALLAPQPAKKPTPLPKLQISILLLLQLVEPISSQSIYPYINQLVSELDITGGDEKKVGYYAGLIESLFFATETLFVMQWSRLSDHTGRKPVLLIGTAGLCVSMIFFGLSRTFWGLVVSRCLVGMLNGNIGVMKSTIAELTDSTNIAQGFSLMPISWSLGATIGPLMGGTLVKPHDKWPNVFTHPFWIHYPYFLPSGVAALFTAVVFVIAVIFLKETLDRRREDKVVVNSGADHNSQGVEDLRKEPVPLRGLMVRPVLLSVANYASLAILDIAYRAIQPLFLSTPVELRGLGVSPATIGLVLGTFGIMNGLFQALFFSKIVGRWGARKLFICGMTAFIPLFALCPVINMVARRGGVTEFVWSLICLQLTIQVLMDMSFGCIFMFVTSSAPNRRSLGATNGIAQLAASLCRTVGPAAATSLFAASVEHGWMGGYAVYAVCIAVSCVAICLAAQLPDEPWPNDQAP